MGYWTWWRKIYIDTFNTLSLYAFQNLKRSYIFELKFSVIILGFTVDFLKRLYAGKEYLKISITLFYIHMQICMCMYVCVKRCTEDYHKKKKTRILYSRFITQTSWGKRRENGVSMNKITLYKMVFVYMYVLLV